MSRWKLTALDMDGTLLTSDKQLHPDTIRDIQKARNEGMQFVYCSGRTIPEIRLYRDRLPMIRYAVCMSGSLVYDFEEEKILYRRAVEQKYVLDIIDAAKADDGMVHLLADTESIVRGDQVTHMADFCRGEYQDTFLATVRTVSDMRAEALKYESVPKVNIYSRSPAARTRAYERLKDLPLTFVCIETASLEINAEGVSKANGMKALTDHLGLQMADVCAIGDSENDRTILQAAGYSIAMGNAEPSILELCDAATDDNDHNGVGKAVLSLI